MGRIDGRYEVTATLGSGGMGVVYRALDHSLDRDVALKTLHEFTDPQALKLFYKECGALKSISHPNIVEIYDIGEYEEGSHKKPYFVMPLLEGHSLDALIKTESHRLAVERVVDIITQACRGLQAAHEKGLIHRDLKPSNIFVMADDSVKLIDFGVVREASNESRSTGYDKGTLLYMAPEQLQHQGASPQSDIYSLALVAYEALTRRRPFQGTTEESVVRAILTRVPQPASELNTAVSHLISRTVQKGLAKQPWNRYDSAKEFSDTLQKALRNIEIEIFDPARIRPRIDTAKRALQRGDYQFARDIVTELETEGNVDPELTLLHTQVEQIARQRTLAQLLESAQARYQEGEDLLALQKVQEILQLDSAHVGALGLRSQIESRRNAQQLDKWFELARRHTENHAYEHAREALENALRLRPSDTRARQLLDQVDAAEREFVRVREEKGALYRAAVDAWKNGHIEQALSQMNRVLAMERHAPDPPSSGNAGLYQGFYDQIRSAVDGISQAAAEARRLLADGALTRVVAICDEFLSKHPGHALFQAIRLDVEEQQRQQLSAYIAALDRQLEVEPNLDVRVSLLREAVARFPDESYFARMMKAVADKQALVASLAERARVHEGAGQLAEALGDLETLGAVHTVHPGLPFEQERLRRRLEQQRRDSDRGDWVRRVQQLLRSADYAGALALLDRASAEFDDDPALSELRHLARRGADRLADADRLLVEGTARCERGEFDGGIALIEQSLSLETRSSVVAALCDRLANEALRIVKDKPDGAMSLADRALSHDPSHGLATTLKAEAGAAVQRAAVELSATLVATRPAAPRPPIQPPDDVEPVIQPEPPVGPPTRLLFSESIVSEQSPSSRRSVMTASVLAHAGVALAAVVAVLNVANVPVAPEITKLFLFVPPDIPAPPVPERQKAPERADPKPQPASTTADPIQPVIVNEPTPVATAPVEAPPEIREEVQAPPQPAPSPIEVKTRVQATVGTAPPAANVGSIGAPIPDPDSQPVVVREGRVSYPQEALKERVGGTVEIAVVVDPAGKVVRARVERGPRLLEAAALEAAGAYQFRPGRKRGMAVYTEVIIEITFTVPRS